MQEISNRTWRWPVSPGVMLVVLMATLVVIAAGLTLVTASDRSGTTKPETATSAIDIGVDATQVGATFPDDAFGLSFEVRALTQEEFGEGNLVQHLGTLGPGVLRIGGNSSDRMFWTSS